MGVLLRSRRSYGLASAATAAGVPTTGCCATAATADGNRLRREVIEELQLQRQQLLQYKPQTRGLFFLHRPPRGSSWRSAASAVAAAAARAHQWFEDQLRTLLTERLRQQQQHRLRQPFCDLLTRLGLRSSSNTNSNSSTSNSFWQLLWTGFVAAAAAATAAMAASPTLSAGGDLTGRTAGAAASQSSLNNWVASSLLQCSGSALSFWGVCTAGTRMQQALGISCSSVLSKPLGLVTIAVASNAAAAAAAAAGFACSRLQQLRAGSSSGPSGWLEAAKTLQQETRGKWGGLLLQHHPRASSLTLPTSSSTGTSSSSGSRQNLLRLCAGETVGCLVLYYLLGGRLFRLSPSSLVAPGAFSERSLSLSASTVYASDTERRLIKKVGLRFGCHTCGTRSRSTRWVADHQPPTAQVLNYERTALGWALGALRRLLGGSKYWPQRLYPHCESCSLKQAVAVRRQTAAAAAATAAAAAAATPLTAAAAAAKLREKKNLLQKQQLVYRWKSLRLWHFTGGILTLIRCLEAL
ncbi:Chromosome III, complete sequence, related [Eimeria mitis]|uniref:Chromosome III, complete sequence, related n=1 Tax=Eimeria mitis TaxID=44415 RepID=U6K0I2_9EIME|nr:Chromosome III, complete sequence, related [Eimeria mitis]CDJ31250.1 Chromosome III, complete sequence, related [Eimeria mitis]